jgi:hypothetical protein
MKCTLKSLCAGLIVNAKLASGFLKPAILIFFTWLCGFCHMASQ